MDRVGDDEGGGHRAACPARDDARRRYRAVPAARRRERA
jgi:hypothetical protein